MLQFVPPDGKFRLMQYRLTAPHVTIPVSVAPRFQWARGAVTFDITVRPDAALPRPLDGLELRFALPAGVHEPALAVGDGHVRFDVAAREIVWTIGAYAKKEGTELRGNATTEQAFDIGGRFPVINVRFVTTGAVPSNFQILGMEVVNVAYKVNRLIKYTTRAGNYEVLTGSA
jgi:AP-3 complex subunit mu